MEPQFTPIADHALLVTFADQISDDAHAKVVSLDAALAADPPAGMVETVPALVNLLICFDVAQTDHAVVTTQVHSLLQGMNVRAATGVQRQVQVCYDDDLAPDLATVATATGLTHEAVINAHLAGDYRVLMYGFAPGYAYLSGVPQQIAVPRKPTPVRDVPAGSVIIAGPQCLVTTLTMPTGWSIIGRSPTRVLTGDADQPFLFDVGDRVRFTRIDRAAFDRLSTAMPEAANG